MAELTTVTVLASSGGGGNSVAIAGLVVAGIVGLVGPALTVFFAAKRQATELDAERARLEATLAADRRKAMIEVRRELLDAGAVLIVELEEALGALLETRDTAEPHDWEAFVKKLFRFRARLRLWFDDSSEVVEAFTDLTNHMRTQHVELQIAASSREFVDELAEKAGEDDEHVIALRKEDAAKLEERAAAVENAQRRYLDAARDYIAGEAF